MDTQLQKPITPEEIRDLLNDIVTKEFATSVKGYDNREVDEYLDTVADALQRVMNTMVAMNDELQRAKMTRPAAAPAPTPMPTPVQTAGDMSDVEEVLTAAVKLKNSLISEAQNKADAIVAEAEERARNRLGALTDEEKRLEASVSALKQTVAGYRAAIAELIRNEQAALDAMADPE